MKETKLIDQITASFSVLSFQLILLSAVLFSLGLALTDLVIERNIRWLIVYPTWVYEKIEKWMKKFSNMILTFLFIIFFNTFNLFLGFISGFLIVLPLILAIWTGLNVGIIIRKTIGDQEGVSLLYIFLNPVAIFELPAGWISFALGIEMTIKYFTNYNYSELWSLFIERSSVFIWLVIPLLIISGLIEAAMIHFVQNKIEKKDE